MKNSGYKLVTGWNFNKNYDISQYLIFYIDEKHVSHVMDLGSSINSEHLKHER